MKPIQSPNGFTLLKMTVALMVLITSLGIGIFVSTKYGERQVGRAAYEELRFVYAAQLMYLADKPTAVVADITTVLIIPYLANRATTIPTVKSLEGVHDEVPGALPSRARPVFAGRLARRAYHQGRPVTFPAANCPLRR